jgi:hypothetical protein
MLITIMEMRRLRLLLLRLRRRGVALLFLQAVLLLQLLLLLWLWLLLSSEHDRVMKWKGCQCAQWFLRDVGSYLQPQAKIMANAIV